MRENCPQKICVLVKEKLKLSISVSDISTYHTLGRRPISRLPEVRNLTVKLADATWNLTHWVSIVNPAWHVRQWKIISNPKQKFVRYQRSQTAVPRKSSVVYPPIAAYSCGLSIKKTTRQRHATQDCSWTPTIAYTNFAMEPLRLHSLPMSKIEIKERSFLPSSIRRCGVEGRRFLGAFSWHILLCVQTLFRIYLSLFAVVKEP